MRKVKKGTGNREQGTASSILARSSVPYSLFPVPSPGFTLIEVLVTLLLIAIVIPTVMKGMTLGGKTADQARHRNEAVELAEGELGTILSSQSWQNGSQSGDFNPNWPGYTWESSVAAWPGDTAGAGLQEIDLTVKWTEGSQPASIVLSSLAYARVQPASTSTQ
jgi:prepilin-type N-terminal cleavage/methylation domain-containing protein